MKTQRHKDPVLIMTTIVIVAISLMSPHLMSGQTPHGKRCPDTPPLKGLHRVDKNNSGGRCISETHTRTSSRSPRGYFQLIFTLIRVAKRQGNSTRGGSAVLQDTFTDRERRNQSCLTVSSGYSDLTGR
ncbi:hypothetical protein JOB18_033789 [Solea senegalensis]|uniref:Secreted protein n=1 Tax=Solea senegalensis TaxID=28829 RepID=A0AAV6RCR0_SOLSE|nr:hypothetical protein JOB18_033789 [Solea senegalensis]